MWRQQLGANAAVFVAFLPWVPSFLTQFDHSSKEAEYLSKVAPLTASQLAEISGKSLVAHPFVSMADLPGPASLAVLALTLVASAAALAHAALSGRQAFRPSTTGRPALVVLLAVAPLVGLALYSARPNTSLLLARNLSGRRSLCLVGHRLAAHPSARHNGMGSADSSARRAGRRYGADADA